MIKRIWNLTLGGFCVVGLAGCAQMGFLSSGFFDRGPTVLESCAKKVPLPDPQTGETFVRPTNCEQLDQAKLNLANGDLAGAEQKYRSSIELFTLDETRRTDLRAAWYGLAATYDEQRRFNEADKAYSTIKSLFGEDARYLNNFGYSQYLRGNFQDAETNFRAALAIKPDDEHILSNLELVTKPKPTMNPDANPDSVDTNPMMGLPPL